MYTDLTRACPHCLLRVRAARDKCPRCGGTDLCDAQEMGSRWRAVPANRTADELKELSDGEQTVVMILAMLGTVGALFGSITAVVRAGDPDVMGSDYRRSFVVMIAFLGGGRLSFYLARRLVVALRGLGSRAARPPRASVEVPVTPAAAGAEALRGRVIMLDGASIIAPMSGRRCVAFRLVGRNVAYEVDDAGAVPFLVETSDGRRVVVDAVLSRVALPTGPRRSPWAGGYPDLRAFLALRGVASGMNEAVLGESVLVEGDMVEVEGVPEAIGDSAARGYRSTANLVVRDRPQHPLTIRRA